MADQAGNRTSTGQFPPNVSGNPSGRPVGSRSRTKVTESELNARREKILARLDGWNNTTTGLGISGKDKTVGTSFSVDIVDPELGAQIWRGDSVGARIVELRVDDMLREGYELCIGDDDVVDTYKPPDAPVQTPEAPVKGVPDASNLQIQRKRTDNLGKYAAHPSAYQRRVRKAIVRQRMDAGDAKPLEERVQKKFRDLQVDLLVKEAMHFERAICAGALLIGANDYTTDLRLPLDLKKVRSLDYLTPIEARELMPLYWYNDPFKPKFGQIAIYQLVPQVVGTSIDGTYRNGITQIHESRLIVFPGIKTTRRNMSGVINGFGDNVFTRLYQALSGYNSGNQSAKILLADFAQAIYKIKGLADLMSRDKNALFDSMMNVELSRAIARAIVIDSEEDFKRESTSLAGYADMLDRAGQVVCAASGYPATLLLGISPGGLNATGASDVRLYYDTVASGQTQRVAPVYLRLAELEIACAGEDPDTVNHSMTFNSLWQPTELEQAQARYAQAQTDQIYTTIEAVSPEEIAMSRFGGDKYSFETHIDFEARHAQEAISPPPVDANPQQTPIMNQYGSPLPVGATKTPDPRNAPTIPEE